MKSIVLIMFICSSVLAVDYDSYLKSQANMTYEKSQFDFIKEKLKRSFNDLCGDTYCEGDYDQIIPQDLACELDAETKMITSCSWSFDASNDETSMFYNCRFEVSQSASTFFRKLEASDLESILTKNVLPQKKSINDVLLNCL